MHIPYADLNDRENAGKYVIASISPRDAVNYNQIASENLKANAHPVETMPEIGIMLFHISGSFWRVNLFTPRNSHASKQVA